MTSPVMIYCPLKPPDKDLPSGIPRIGALYAEALRQAGFSVVVPALPSTFEPTGDAVLQRELVDAAGASTRRMIDLMRREKLRPRAWVTYHCYYKSPDVAGPMVATEFGCPYVIAEGSYAKKRASGPWSIHHGRATVALCSANILLAVTERDREGLESIPGRTGVVIDFPPFVDNEQFRKPVRGPSEERVCILAAGSMRDQRKLASYRRLLESLHLLAPKSFVLRIAGDGPGRDELEDRAKPLRDAGAKIEFLGRIAPSRMPEFFAHGDIFAWPGVGEAFGLTYLEAQAAGLPVVAENHGGVSACVRNDVSGILVQKDHNMAFGEALRRLVVQPELRRRLGESAMNWVATERSLSAASKRLGAILAECGA